MNNGILINSIYFIFFLFLMIVLFIVLGGPVDTIFDSMTSNPVVPEQTQMVPNYKLAARLAFAIGITTPVVWFVAKMFSREPAVYKYRRR